MSDFWSSRVSIPEPQARRPKRKQPKMLRWGAFSITDRRRRRYLWVCRSCGVRVRHGVNLTRAAHVHYTLLSKNTMIARQSILASVNVYARTCTTCIFMFIGTYMYMYIHMYIYINTCVYIRIHIFFAFTCIPIYT